MDFIRLAEKQKIFAQGRKNIDSITLVSYEKDFELFIRLWMEMAEHRD